MIVWHEAVIQPFASMLFAKVMFSRHVSGNINNMNWSILRLLIDFSLFLILSAWETWVFSTSVLEVGKFFNCKLLNFDDKFFNLVTVAVQEMALVNIRAHVMMTWISDQISNSTFKSSRHLLRSQLGIYLRHPCKI